MTSSEPDGLHSHDGHGKPVHWILDTNIVVDLCVFDDPASAALRAQVQSGAIVNFATPAMRAELERVLGYPHIAARMQIGKTNATAVMSAFDQFSVCAAEAPKASCTCKDPDDQKFIDLAVAHTLPLLSKDAAVLCMRARLDKLGVKLNPTLEKAMA